MDLKTAIITANEFMAYLAPACARIEIVGGVKRQDAREVHDIELLMILNGQHPRPEFGDKVIHKTMLDKILYDLKDVGRLRDPLKRANGEKYKKFAIVDTGALNEFCLDLFIVNESTWGIQNVIRTGPKFFAHSYVTPQGVKWVDRESGQRGYGLLPEIYQYVRGETCIMAGDVRMNLPDEEDAIALLGYGWIEPGKRRNYVRLE